MGNSESKFFEFLNYPQPRDGSSKTSLPGEEEIIRKMHSSESDVAADLAERFNPNKRMSQSLFKDSPLIYAVRYEHKLFLNECLQRDGDPFATNGNGETAFHVACSSHRASQRADKKRKELLQLLLDQPLRGSAVVREDYGVVGQVASSDGDREFILNGSWKYHPSVAVKDGAGNTPLHRAASSGLLGCVELLLAHGAPLNLKNADQKTACDLAVEGKQLIISKLLESKMVLVQSDVEPKQDPDLEFRAKTFTLDRNPDGLMHMQKDMIEAISVDLDIPPQIAESLLHHHRWSKEAVVDAWRSDREATMREAGVDPNLEPGASMASLQVHRNVLCEICGCEVDSVNERVKGLSCRHKFCKDCFAQYIEIKVVDGKVGGVKCPGSGCDKVIPTTVLENHMSASLREKYQRFGLQEFVDASCQTKWCPHTACGKVVSYISKGGGASERSGVNVECEDGHTFCWECLEEPGHEPLPCDLWNKWQSTIEDYHKGQVDLTRSMITTAENVNWIALHTKPCPRCKCPIQKNYGCNHMTCTKCRYDFCWVCLDPWSSHNRETGGYFQCNRVARIREANQKMELIREDAATQARDIEAAMREQRRETFEALYSKYQSHLENMVLDRIEMAKAHDKQSEMEKLASVLDARVTKVAKATGCWVDTQSNGPVGDVPFLYLVYGVLVRTRPILAASYALSFLLDPTSDDMEEHSTFQARIEEQEERLSRMVHGPHLRATRAEIVAAAKDLVQLCSSYTGQFCSVAERCLQRTRAPATPPPEEEEEEEEVIGNEANPYVNAFLRILIAHLEQSYDWERTT